MFLKNITFKRCRRLKMNNSRVDDEFSKIPNPLCEKCGKPKVGIPEDSCQCPEEE